METETEREEVYSAYERGYDEGYDKGSKNTKENMEWELRDGGWNEYLIEECRRQGIDPLEPFMARYDTAERRWFFEQGADR